MAELSDIKTGERTVAIKHPRSNEDYGIEVDLISLDDDRLTKLKRRIQDRSNWLEARGKTFTAEEIEQNKLELFATSITGWRWLKDPEGEQNTFHGEVPEYNRKNVQSVCRELPWFARQITVELGDTEAFFAKPATV